MTERGSRFRPWTDSEAAGRGDTRSTSPLLIILLSVDAIFVLLYCLQGWVPGLDSPKFSIETDRGYSELYQYVKFASIVAVIAGLGWLTRTAGYTSWALLFTYLLLDDALHVHERYGRAIADRIDWVPPLGLRAQDVGELAVSAMAGSLLVGAIAWTYLRSSPSFRKVSLDLSLLVLFLAFFGVLVDTVHGAVEVGPKWETVLAVIEDGGEMVVVSLILRHAVLLALRRGGMARGRHEEPARPFIGSRLETGEGWGST